MDKSISNLIKMGAAALLGVVFGSLMVTSVFAAGVIADTPMMVYPGGGHNFLIIYGNDSSMEDKLSNSETRKSKAVREAVSNLFKQGATLDTSSTLYKAVNANHSIGMGLMTYGGTSDTSPYLWPFSAKPYDTYKDEITTYCKTVNNNVTTADWGDLFYLGADPKAHPYCLPVTVPRPTGYATGNGECSKEYSESKLYCYSRNGKKQSPSHPELGKLVIPIEAKPLSELSSRGELFYDKISDADPSGYNAIEGAMLTACDYFNTLWLDSNSNTRSACSRGYPSSQPFNYPPFSDTKQGYKEDLPKIPNTCGSSTIFITDNFPNITADGQTYTPNFDLVESKRDSNPDDPFGFNDHRTDPAITAISAMAESRREQVRTFFLGLGMTSSSVTCKKITGNNLNSLACAGYNGSALAYYPTSKESLQSQLSAIISEQLFTPKVQNLEYTLTPLLLNGDTVASNPVIFKPAYKFNSGGAVGWVGDIEAFIYDGTNSLGTWNKVWSASDNLNYHINPSFSATTRLMYTYNPVANSGVDLLWANLTTTQISLLGGSGSKRLIDWLRGNANAETGSAALRPRSGYIFGDIVNSKMAYAGAQDYSNDILPEGLNSADKPYKTYLQQKAQKIPMLYVGANDGLLHGFSIGGFNGSTYDKAAYSKGTEVFAYLPNAVITSPNSTSGTLSRLTQYASNPNFTNGSYYPHVYSVDGQIEIGDAYINEDWKTILVGTTGTGAKGIFVLDITCPVAYSPAGCSSGVSKNNVMWEISDTDNDASTPTLSDAASIHNDLGYTYAKPSIARLNNGTWAVIVGNGYHSANGHAVLFIFNLEDGRLIRKIDTGIGSSSTKNGLSSTTLVDIDSNRTVDYVYAGDLYGNVWKFDLRCPSKGSCSPSSAWVAPEKPFLIACQSSSNPCAAADRQPITQSILVDTANASTQASGLMVYVGTGQYFELGDNVVPTTSPLTQSIYGVWDTGDGVTVTRNNLTQQNIVAVDSSHRKTTGIVDYKSSQGWYMDLKEPGSGGQSIGERVFQDPVLREGVLYIETLIPYSQASCGSGGGGWNWQLDATTGGGNAWGGNSGVAYTAPVFFSTKASGGGGSPGSSVTINTKGEIVKPEETEPMTKYKVRGRASWNQIQ